MVDDEKDVTAAPSTATDAPAAPSTASDVKADPSTAGVETSSMLDAVKTALKSTKEESPTSEPGKEQAQVASPEQPPSESQDLTDAELKRYSPNAQNRIRELAARKNELQAEVERQRPKTEQFDRLTAHLRQHSISNSDFNNAIELVRLGKHDPQRALEALSPIIQDLVQRTGNALPPELQERVRLGYLTEQDARELTRTRAQAQLLEERQRRAEETRQRTDQERVQAAHQALISETTQASDQWAKAKAGSDPDWNKKQDLVANELTAELYRAGQNGYPRNATQAVALLEKCLNSVENRIKLFRPELKQIVPATGSASPRSQAEPETMLDAINMGLSRLKR